MQNSKTHAFSLSLRAHVCVLQVASVFSVSVEHLADPTNHRHTKFRRPIRFYFPVFLGGDRRVWGITGFMLDAALSQILPPELNYRPLSSFGAAYATS